MVDEVNNDLIPVDSRFDPITILEEDLEDMRGLQAAMDAMVKIRQEMGRLYQVISNLCLKANEAEQETSKLRKTLVSKYGLDKSPGQWVIDFERHEFVKTADTAPIVP